MHLDIIIPTYNRHQMLGRALDSLLAADVPDGLHVEVTVVDNNSSDGTREVVESQVDRFGGRLKYIFEQRQGGGNARNAGIAATRGELVGMVDDDEEVDAGWFQCVYETFREGGVDFIGGPYVPRWSAEQPVWLPKECCGVIGWIDSGDQVIPYDERYPGILMGGNAVLTRAILEKVGPYSSALGRFGNRLLAGEDDDIYRRLLKAGARGFYVPGLIIYHYIPPERLTKRYFRQWSFWRGVSCGLIDRQDPLPVAYLAGVPRYLYGRAARGVLGTAAGMLAGHKDPARRFANELAVWDLFGFFYGKHFYRAAG